MSGRFLAIVALICLAVATPLRATPEQQRELYTRTLARERVLREGNPPPSVQQIREVVAAYERFVRRFPISGYSDNALWQAGNLSLLAFQRFGQASDRRTGLRLLNQLKTSYPSSSLLERYEETVAELEAEPDAEVPVGAAPKPAPPVAPVTLSSASPPPRSTPEPASNTSVKPIASTGEPVAIRAITRTALTDGVRVSIEMDGEIAYHHERLENPRRVFFDLKGARPVAKLLDATLKFPDDPIPEIRLGRHPQNTTRIVLDMRGADGFSVFTLYNPYRLVIDFHRNGAPSAAVPRMPAAAPVSVKPGSLATDSKATAGLVIPSPVVPASEPIAAAPIEKIPLPSRAAVPPALSAPAVPSANSNGRFSIARQLGLGVSRVVIDAGHGGHDPGAHGNGINEADLVLDVALRLRKLLAEQAGVEVVMTRDTDVFIPLEERTAIANRESADLFLSIHANASRDTKARGIETYFLNFASNPEAAAVAARENTMSGKTMHSLPEIVRAITLNNKIDESRDFAELVQKAMIKKLTVKNTELRDLGVKQAPFVVLIGAGMPSVLAEISFLTHKQEGQLLKTQAYREQIAEALFDAVQGYQKSLKSRSAVASTREE